MRLIPAFLVILEMLLHSSTGRADSPLLPAKQLVNRRVLVIAHRGASAHSPENTLPAFANAVECGADLVELDYYHSADGVPIVFHDKDLDRTTDALRVLKRKKTPVASLSFDQLRALDAGSWRSAAFRGTRIPTLVEALDAIQPNSTTLIERKQGDAKTCVSLLQSKQLLNRVVVQSFDWDYLKDCHRLAPDLVLGALGDKELTSTKLEQISTTGATVVGWSEKDLRIEDVERVHARGWRLWVYTVDDPKRAEALVAAGVDGIITNDPALMLKVLHSSRPQP